MILAQNGVDDMHLDLIKDTYAVDPYYMDPTHSRVTRLQHENGFYYYTSRLCIPDDTYIRTLLLKKAHEPAYSRHHCIARTLANLSRIAWWPHLPSDVKSFVRACHSFQDNKPANQAPAGLLQPLPVPEQYCNSVSLDFMMLQGEEKT
jgi:hypothetical protein